MGGWPYQQGHPGATASMADLYYRQAAAAAALQKPLPYRLYPPVPSMGPLNTMGSAGPQFSPPGASPIASLTNFYQNSKADNNHSTRSPSPTLNPGSPPPKKQRLADSSPTCSDDEEHIQV